jgi:hypothetical protein
MPFPNDIHYPAAATKAAWLKAKSLIDKTGKTGVGPKLEAAETAWGKIPFGDLDERYHKPANSQAAQTALTKANSAMTKVATARHALGEAITLAGAPATTTGLTGASKTALAAIVTALKAADKRLENMSDIPQLFQVDLHTVQKDEAEELKAQQDKAEEDRRKQAAEDHAALAELTIVKLMSGSTVIAKADKAVRQPDGNYWAMKTEWSSMADHGLNYLQKNLTLIGRDKKGRNFSQDRKLIGVVGDGTAKLKQD